MPLKDIMLFIATIIGMALFLLIGVSVAMLLLFHLIQLIP